MNVSECGRKKLKKGAPGSLAALTVNEMRERLKARWRSGRTRRQPLARASLRGSSGSRGPGGHPDPRGGPI